MAAVSGGHPLMDDLALARVVATAAASVPGVDSLCRGNLGQGVTVGPRETIQGVAIDRSLSEPVPSVHLIAKYRPGENLLDLASRVRQAALNATAVAWRNRVKRIDVTVHDIVIPAGVKT